MDEGLLGSGMDENVAAQYDMPSEVDAQMLQLQIVQRLGAVADQLSTLTKVCVETRVATNELLGQVAKLSDVLQQFSDVSPAELMNLLGQMTGH